MTSLSYKQPTSQPSKLATGSNQESFNFSRQTLTWWDYARINGTNATFSGWAHHSEGATQGFRSDPVRHGYNIENATTWSKDFPELTDPPKTRRIDSVLRETTVALPEPRERQAPKKYVEQQMNCLFGVELPKLLTWSFICSILMSTWSPRQRFPSRLTSTSAPSNRLLEQSILSIILLVSSWLNHPSKVGNIRAETKDSAIYGYRL